RARYPLSLTGLALSENTPFFTLSCYQTAQDSWAGRAARPLVKAGVEVLSSPIHRGQRAAPSLVSFSSLTRLTRLTYLPTWDGTLCPAARGLDCHSGHRAQPNSYGARALPRPVHSTSGACNE